MKKQIALSVIMTIITATHSNTWTMNPDLPFAKCILAGQIEKLKEMLENGQDPAININGNSALHFAAIKGDLKATKIILDFCKSKDNLILTKNNSSKTPIDMAKTTGNTEIVTYLENILKKQEEKLEKKESKKIKELPCKKHKSKTQAQFHIPYKQITFVCAAAVLVYCLIYVSKHTSS